MKRKFTCLILILFICSISGFAQDLAVQGVITDAKTNEPLIGATVQQQGTTNGTLTDFDGNFTIHVPAGTTLVFSYIGYTSKNTVVQNDAFLRITLSQDTELLDEVVVVGYGIARKRDVTGAIVSIKGDDLKFSPDYNPVKSLQGKVAGLSITNSGTAGGSPTVRIRGVATTEAKTDPLYIVDGLFTDNIDFVNSNDVLSVEVLKDPSSLAIFGVQGANGVIIITTKRASEGQLNVTYDGYAGVQTLHNRDRLKLTNASEFTLLYNELIHNMDPNADEWTGDLLGKGTDWQSLIFREAFITNHSISISQANEKASSIFSLGYFKQDGILKYNSYQRFNGRWAGDYKLNKYIKAGGNVALTRWDVDPATAEVANAAKALPTYQPYAPEEDHDPNNLGSYYTPSPGIQKDVPNPVSVMEINKGNSESYGYRAVGNIYAEVSFLKDFTFRATGYGDVGINYDNNYTPRFDVNNENSISSYRNESTKLSRKTGEYKKYQVDLMLNYNKEIDLHRIGAVAGYTARMMENQGFEAAADSLIDGKTWIIPEDMRMLNLGEATTKTNSDWYNSESFISYLGRVSYSYAGKYLATLSMRADVSSKFGPSNRWGYFPAVGLGWVISEENFWNRNLQEKISFLKLKASWGKLGNDKIKDYLYYAPINPKGQLVVVDGITYYLPTQAYYVDEDIHWEVVTGFDFGFEALAFDNRLSMELGYYTKTTNDLLATVEAESPRGKVAEITNVGSIRNQGFEYMVSWKDRLGNFSYGISANGATLKNKVLELGGGNDIISGLYHRTSVGHSVGAIYGYVQDGIFQNQQQIDDYYPTPWNLQPGDIRYKDIDGDNEITSRDRKVIGSTIPTFTYGFTVNLGYKDFDFSVDFNGVSGNSIVNTKKLPQYAQFNYYQETLDRWHGEGSSNTEPILDNTRSHNFLPSTNLLESGSYFRIRGMQVGYSIPKNAVASIRLTNVRVYLNAQNLVTFKKNSGYTPEIGGGILNGSVDDGNTYPIPTTYTFGLTVNF